MIREVIKFIPSIAFCHILHWYESKEIRCQELLWLKTRCAHTPFFRQPESLFCSNAHFYTWRNISRKLELFVKQHPHNTPLPIHYSFSKKLTSKYSYFYITLFTFYYYSNKKIIIKQKFFHFSNITFLLFHTKPYCLPNTKVLC